MASELEVGLSNPLLNRSRRRMLDLTNKLHSTGVQVDIDLPQIAVIGSQSAGKSSLIESISGITLPRAAGTCTRCPIECRLSQSDSPWQCIVFLRFITDAKGQPLGQPKNERFGAVIYDKSLVEDRICRAQLALLNPRTPSKKFLNSEDAEANVQPQGQLSFSHNSVTLQISGPDVADLSFCDLPGLIASVSSNRGGSGDDIALVQGLVTTYIKKPSCIILLTVACEKANWLPFIRNEKETLENNWFCVKQPSSNELKSNPSWVDARNIETSFFSNTAPWCDLANIHQKYLRTCNLVERLSDVLSDLISKRLPQIHDELERSILSTRSQLALLPRAPSADPRSKIAALLHTFATDFARHTEGVSDSSGSHLGEGVGLIQAILPAQERFRLAIRSTAPKFRPYESKDAKKKHISPASFLQAEEGNAPEGEASDFEESEDDENERREENNASHSADSDSSSDSSSESAASNESDDEEEEQEQKKVNSTSVAKKSQPPPVNKGVVHSSKKRKQPSTDVIYIDEVLERAHRARTRELPGNYPFVVQKTFIKDIIKEWHAPALVLCKTVHSTVLEHVKYLVHKHFSEFGQGLLAQRIRSIMQHHMKLCLERAEERLVWLLELEDLPFSLNTHYLADYRSKFLAYYKGSRQECNHTDLVTAIRTYENGPDLAARPMKKHKSVAHNGEHVVQTGVAKILAGLAEIGVSGIKPEDLARLLPPDRMEPAIIIMAEVRAYFQVAYKRFADIVPLAIDRELVRGASKDILDVVYNGLNLNERRVCKELAQESPQVADRRLNLQMKLERLDIAVEELLSLGVY